MKVERLEVRLHPNLLQQDIPDAMDDVILVSIRVGGAMASLSHGGQEVPVQGEELVQAGEDPTNGIGVQLHLFSQAPPEDLGHDAECLDMVKLRLHQLWHTQTNKQTNKQTHTHTHTHTHKQINKHAKKQIYE